jgi:hypothetical protein
MTTDYRALCAELIDALDSGFTAGRIRMSPLVDRARAALAAEPEPVVDGDHFPGVKKMVKPADGEAKTLRELALKELDAWSEERNGPGESIICDGLAVRLIRDALAAEPEPPADCPGCEGVPALGNQPCAVCGREASPPSPVEREVAELVAELKLMASDAAAASQTSDAKILARAADLLERLAGPSDGPAVPAGREPASVNTEVNDALAEPEPEGPTDKELHQLWQDLYAFHDGPTSGDVAEIARAVLARWGQP